MKVRGKPFNKGEGGRPRGAKNKISKQTKELLERIVNKYMIQIEKDIELMTPFERVLAVEKIGKYHLPELMKVESENYNENSGEYKIIIDWGDYNKSAQVVDGDKEPG